MKLLTQPMLDKFSISASLICAMHCALTPMLLAIVPNLAFIGANEHLFHLALVWLIVPVSLLAAYSGCKKHRDRYVLALILAGLSLLLVAALLGHDLFGHQGEKLATILASILIALGHWRNYGLCRMHYSQSGGC